MQSIELERIHDLGRDGTAALQIPNDGKVTFCFRSKDHKHKTFYFEYYIKDDPNALKKKVKADHIEDAQNRLENILRYFNVISKNIYRKADEDKELASCKVLLLYKF